MTNSFKVIANSHLLDLVNYTFFLPHSFVSPLSLHGSCTVTGNEEAPELGLVNERWVVIVSEDANEVVAFDKGNESLSKFIFKEKLSAKNVEILQKGCHKI